MRPRRSLIESTVGLLLTSCDITRPTVDLRAIVLKLGLEYVEVSYRGNKAGAVVITHPALGRPVAGVNTNCPSAERRYSLAHQLCHYLLHGQFSVREGTIEPDEKWLSVEDDPPPRSVYKPRSYNVYEAEADIFAVSLLVPQSFLKVLRREERTIESIASRFDVPRAAAVPTYNSLLKKIRKSSR